MKTIKNTTENTTPIIRRILDICAEDDYISFEKGVYRFNREGSYHGTFYPSNNLSGEKDVVFPILEKRNLVVDGNGSKFIFCDRIFPFIVQNCKNVTFRNFSIDFSFPRYCFAEVEHCDGQSLTVSIDREKYNFYTNSGNIEFVCGNDTISTSKKKLFIKNITKDTVFYLFAGKCEATSENLPAPSVFTYDEETENGIIFTIDKITKNISFSHGDKLLIHYCGWTSIYTL